MDGLYGYRIDHHQFSQCGNILIRGSTACGECGIFITLLAKHLYPVFEIFVDEKHHYNGQQHHGHDGNLWHGQREKCTFLLHGAMLPYNIAGANFCPSQKQHRPKNRRHKNVTQLKMNKLRRILLKNFTIKCCIKMTRQKLLSAWGR